MPYLKTAVSSVLESSYQDFELIVSDDNSSDGSLDYLRSISDPRLNILVTPKRMSMAEHWEWALSNSTGVWKMFLGQDDALHSYYFDHANFLTTEAARHSIRVIAARRSYLFWPGCEIDFQQRAQFFGVNRTYRRSTAVDGFSSLLFGKKYHELPQMYTNSLFHSSLLLEAKQAQMGRIFTCHPQDANLAAIALLLEKSYLRSEIPLGWVGTSPSSAGLAIAKSESGSRHKGNKALASEYSNSINRSEIDYPKFAGSFSLANEAVYLWQALIVVSEQLKPGLARLLRNRFFKTCLFASVKAENKSNWIGSPRWEAFLALLRNNGVSLFETWLPALFFGMVSRIGRFVRGLLSRLVIGRKLGIVGVAGFQIPTSDSEVIDILNLNFRANQIYRELL